MASRTPLANLVGAMEGIYREWCGASGVIVPVELEEDSAMMWRLEAWSERKGCTVEEVAQMVLTNSADSLTTVEEDAEVHSAEDVLRARGLGIRID